MYADEVEQLEFLFRGLDGLAGRRRRIAGDWRHAVRLGAQRRQSGETRAPRRGARGDQWRSPATRRRLVTVRIALLNGGSPPLDEWRNLGVTQLEQRTVGHEHARNLTDGLCLDQVIVAQGGAGFDQIHDGV